jgi:Zn-finger nucleic acid-binding protein
MTQFRIICPECSAAIVTNNREAMIWERCPQCRQHVWEADDLIMSEVIIDRFYAQDKPGNRLRSHNN